MTASFLRRSLETSSFVRRDLSRSISDEKSSDSGGVGVEYSTGTVETRLAWWLHCCEGNDEGRKSRGGFLKCGEVKGGGEGVARKRKKERWL